MTVWIVNPFDNLPLEGARPQRYWLMARAFVAAGWDVVYWTSDFSHAAKKKRAISGDIRLPEAEPGIRVEMIPTLPYAKSVCLARIRSHLRLARDFRRRALAHSSAPALVVASIPPTGLCLQALSAARRRNARFVCDIQDAWPETFGRLLPRGFGWLGSFLFAGMRRTARRIYRTADVVTGVCRRYGELSRRRDFYLAPLGIQADAPGVRRRTDGTPGAKRLVYVGNLGVGYDLETVVAAVAKRTDLTLDIAGLGPREEGLRTLVRKLGLTDRVRFHGYLGEGELQELMAACDVGVIPMRDDSWVGLPNKLGDYLKAGLRILSSLTGECGEFLHRTGFGCVYERTSPDSFLAALDALPSADVSLPDELRADLIYPKYVREVAVAVLLSVSHA